MSRPLFFTSMISPEMMFMLAISTRIAHPARIIPVMGTNNLDRIGQIGRAAELIIDRETWFEIYTAAIGEEVP